MSLSDHAVIESLMPTGGWWYPQQHGDRVQRIPPRGVAGSGSDLVLQVRLYRAMHNLPVDTLEEEIAEHIKKQSPQNNRFPKRKQSAAPRPVRRAGYRPLIERITAWLMSAMSKASELISESDADERADICARCPQNVEWKTGCKPCVSNTIDRSNIIRRRGSYSRDGVLKACRLHELHLPCAVFLARPELPERHKNAPSHCWL